MKKYTPYGIDFKFQYRTYKNIGKTYQIEFKARKNFLYKILNCIRKFNNKNEKKYMNFDAFSQWKQWIRQELNLNEGNNKENITHYLEKYKRNSKIACDMMGAIVTPMYAVVLTLGVTLIMNTDVIKIYMENIGIQSAEIIELYIYSGYISMSIIISSVLVLLMWMFRRNKMKLEFYEDLIDILK